MQKEMQLEREFELKLSGIDSILTKAAQINPSLFGQELEPAPEVKLADPTKEATDNKKVDLKWVYKAYQSNVNTIDSSKPYKANIK